MSEKIAQKNCTLPPWLWFYLIMYMFNLPYNIREIEHYFKYFFSLNFVMSIPELVPSLALFVGIITIFFPWFRARKVENKYNLINFDSSFPKLSERNKKTASEIEHFLKSYAPNLQIKVNFHLFNQDPFLYASGYRKASIALFGKTLGLWKSDPKVAEAMLLHEIGHYRNGDALVTGPLSFFESVLSLT